MSFNGNNIAHASSELRALNSSFAIITLTRDGKISRANNLFLNLFEYELAEIEGRDESVFEKLSLGGGQSDALWAELRGGQSQTSNALCVTKSGKEIWLSSDYVPLTDDEGRVNEVIRIARDMSAQQTREADDRGQVEAIHTSQAVIHFSLIGIILDANGLFLDAMGYERDAIIGRHHSMFVDPSHAASKAYNEFWHGLGQGEHQAGEYCRLGKDGREVWLQATYNPIFDLAGRPLKVVKYAIDITQEKLRQAEFQAQIEAIHKSQGVVTLALDGTILDVNDNFLATLGYALDEIRGRPHSMLVEPDAFGTQEYSDFWQTLRSGQYHTGLYKRIGKDGRALWIQASYNPVLDLNGHVVKVIKFATDVTSNVAMAEAFDDAKRQAHHDAATSLPNRVKLASFMTANLANPGAGMTVFYLDLDRFKPINDKFGHHVGDKVLGDVADRLRRALRSDQIVARVGGDEFVIAAPDFPASEIEDFCHKLHDIVTAPIRHEDGDIAVGVSIGIAIAPMDGTTPDELLRSADTALYRSKQNGRGTYSFFAVDMNDKIIEQRGMADEMRRALINNEFVLEYQPRFDTRGRSIRSVEALVRWAHPERGRISPANFIPVAERNGLIIPLGKWVLRTACQTAMDWDDIGVSVNVSPVQFRDGNLVDIVKDALRESGLPGSRLQLEITEGVLMEDGARAFAILSNLKALGVTLAMDDFGTGYSSLSYLRNFPFDVIKIDRSFIADLHAEGSGRSIVQAILGLGRALGLSVTAEGVETNEQLAMLTLDQCQEVQGFLMARPLDASKMKELLTRPPELTTQQTTQQKTA